MLDSAPLIKGTIAACSEIFDMMLPLKMTERMFDYPLSQEIFDHAISDDVVASIGLTGQFSGTVSLYVSLPMALSLAGWMMEQTYEQLNSEVYESLGEMINMIAGGLKNRLSSPDQEAFNLSIPIVISGKDKIVFHGSNKHQIVIPIETDRGLMTVHLVLEQAGH